METRLCPGFVDSLKEGAEEGRRGRRPFGPKGFTRKVLEILRLPKHRLFENYYSGYVTSSQLIEVSEVLPPENLEERQNFSPRVRDFVEVARAEPKAIFEVYVIPEEREDERLSVEGCWIPSDRQDLVELLLSRARGRPDTFERVGNYVRVWWD
jgi:hypothetical protein